MSFTAQIDANTSGFSQGVDKASKDIERLERTVSERLDKVGDQFVSIGKKASVLSAGIAALTVGAAKSAIDFESAFAGVQKTVDATEEGYAALSRGIRQLAKEIPATTTEIAAVAEAAGQLGIQTENVLSFTRTMIDLGEATNLSSDQAATSFARLANIMQTNQENFGRLGSTVVDLGNNFATTESEITEMALRLAGAGKQAGLSEANVLSLATSLSSVGINAEAGGSAFSKVLMNMQLASEVGGESLQGFAQVAGMSADQFAKSFKDDAAGALISFIQGLQNTEKTGVSAIQILDELGITEVRMRDALLRSAGAGDTMRKAIELGNKAWEENTALTEEAAKRYATTSSQLKILGNYVADLGIQFGELLLPVINSAVAALKSFTEWLADLSPVMQKTILILGGVAAAIGPVMLGLGGLIKMLPVLRAGFAAMTGPVGLAIAAVSALAIGLAVFATRTKEVSSVSAEFSRELSEQTKALDDNFSKLKETASGTDSRRIAIEEINSKYGPYLDNLLTEKSSLEDIEKAQKKATQELAKSIAFKAQQSDLSKFRDAIANSETEFSQALKQLVSLNDIPAQVSGELAAELDKMMSDWSETDIKNRVGFGEAFAQVFKDAGVEIDLLGARGNRAYQGLYQSMQGVIDARQDERRATEDLSAAYDGYLSKIGLGNEAYSETVETVEDLGNGLEGVLQGNEDIREVIARTASEIAELTQRLEGLRSGAIAVQDVRAEIEETEDKIKDLNNALKTLQGEREISIAMKISGNEGGGFDSMIEDITTRAAASMDALQNTLAYKMEMLKNSVGIGIIDVSNLLAQGVAGFAESIGTAFATGDWDNMGSELIKAVGGLAMQFGATLISMGFAALALKALIVNPFTAIAAGVALVALGAAATAAASKQVSAATGGGAGGGRGGSTGYRDTASPGQSEYRGAWKDDFRVEFVQKGSDLVGVLDAAEQRRRRS